MKVTILTSQTGSFRDLSLAPNVRNYTMINQTHPGTIGRYCDQLNIGLPNVIDMKKFARWAGQANEVIAGPVREVFTISNQLSNKGHDVRTMVLTGSGWLDQTQNIHPFWPENKDWWGIEPDEQVTTDSHDSEFIVVCVPNSILKGNRGLRDLIECHQNAAVACGKNGHSEISIRKKGLRLYTKGVARLGKSNRSLLFQWLNSVESFHFQETLSV